MRNDNPAYGANGALLFLHVERLAGEGEFDGFGFEALHHLYIDPLVDLGVAGIIEPLLVGVTA